VGGSRQAGRRVGVGRQVGRQTDISAFSSKWRSSTVLYSSNPVVNELQFSKAEIRTLLHSWVVSVVPGSFHKSCVRLIKCSSSVTYIFTNVIKCDEHFF
jgi:hypothetical protein